MKKHEKVRIFDVILITDMPNAESVGINLTIQDFTKMITLVGE